MPGELATSGIVLGVLSLVPLMTLACFGLVVGKLLRQGEVFAAAISLICLFLCGLGLFVALAYGWSKAGEWRIRRLMMAYSLSLVLCFILPVLSPFFLSHPGRPSPKARPLGSLGMSSG